MVRVGRQVVSASGRLCQIGCYPFFSPGCCCWRGCGCRRACWRHRVAAPRGSTAEQAHIALAWLLHITPDDALGLAVSGAHVLVLAVQAPEVDLRRRSATTLVVRLLLPVDELQPVQKLCMPRSHAVVSWREPPQGLGGDGHRLWRRIAATTSWREAAAHQGIGGIPDGAPDHRAHCADSCASEHARRAAFRTQCTTDACSRSGSGQHLPNAHGGSLARSLAHH